MNNEDRNKISAMDEQQLRAVFWQTYGWMENHNKIELDQAIHSAIINVSDQISALKG